VPDLVAAHRYYYACDLLWATFSAWQYMLEDVITLDYDALPQQWDGLHNTLAAWLIHESVDTARTDLQADTLNQAADPPIDAIVYQWGSVAQHISQHAYSLYPSINPSLWTYYCYCRWLPFTLAVFDQLFLVVPLCATIFAERYHQQRSTFSRLARMLDNEYPTLSDLDVTRTAPPDTLYGIINGQGKELAHAWKELLDSIA
jgi:hypothetical protein